MTYQRALSRIIPFALIALLMAGAFVLSSTEMNDRVTQLDQTTLLPLGKPLGEFHLTTQHNETFSVDNLKGHWSIVFFGYTTCPTLCPKSLEFMEQISKALPEDLFQFLFVSSNPSVDSPEQLAMYLKPRPSNFVGLTGSLSSITILASQLGAYVEPNETSVEGHIAHSGSLFVLNPKGEYVALISEPHDIHTVIHELKTLLKTKS